MINRKGKKRGFLMPAGILLALLLPSAPLAAEDVDYPAFRVDIAPSLAFPLGTDIDYFGPGLGSTAFTSFTMPFLPSLSLGPEAGYSVNLLQGEAEDRLSTIRGGVCIRFSPFLARWLMISLQGGGGLYYSFLNGETGQKGYNPYAGARFGLTAVFGEKKQLGIGVEGTFTSYLGFFSEAGVTVSASLHLGKRISPRKRGQTIIMPETKPQLKPLQFSNFRSEQIFPTLSVYYDDHAFGRVEIHNPNDTPLEDVRILFFINTYMDTPKECARVPKLGPGESKTVDLYALFNTEILEIYEKTKVTALVQAKYSSEDTTGKNEQPYTVEILDRNALVWDDDRRAAAFVTAKDPVIMKFAKNVMSLSESEKGINENIYKTMAVFTALKELGVSYTVDPASSYQELSGSARTIDYLQYPRQTLDYKSGDCDDLSVLAAALLESVGIETAFITIPGHIFTAFSLGVPYTEAAGLLSNPKDLIEYSGQAWLPLEVTFIKEGFVAAWEEGAKEWQQAEKFGEADFYPIHEAWKTYESVAFFEDAKPRFPDEKELTDAIAGEHAKFVALQLEPKIRALESRLETDSHPYRIKNKIGILYARYGLYKRAGEAFSAALEISPDYKPALVNMGNLHVLRQAYDLAVEYYQQAAEAEKEDPAVLISLALAYRELGNHDLALKHYNDAQELKPDLAERYSHLAHGREETARAGGRKVSKDELFWQE